MVNIFKWSKTSADNASDALPDINWQENQAPSTVNNSSRNEMAHVAKYRDDLGGVTVVGGTVDAVEVTSNSDLTEGGTVSPTVLPDGFIVTWKQTDNNTGAMTLAVDGIPGKPLRPNNANPVVEFEADVFKTGEYITAIYDAANDMFLGRGSKEPKRTNLEDLDPSIAGALVQVGTVIPWALDSVPAGWYECMGQELNRAAYADLDALFSADGYPYGDGDAATTFNLPDYRGRFHRAQDSSAEVDPEENARTDRGDGLGGDRVGTKQGDQFDNHTHTWNQGSGSTNTTGSHTHTYSRTIQNKQGDSVQVTQFIDYVVQSVQTGSAGNHSHTVTVSGSNVTAGGTETRPINIYVKYIIFASPSEASGNPAQINTVWNEDFVAGDGVNDPTGSIGRVGDFLINPDTATATEYFIYGPKLIDNDWSTSDRVNLIGAGSGGGGGDAEDIVFDPDLATYGATPYVTLVDIDVQLALDRVGAAATTNANNLAAKAPVDDPTFTTGITTPLLTMDNGGVDTAISFEGVGDFNDWDIHHDPDGTNDLTIRRFDAGGANPANIQRFEYSTSEVLFELGSIRTTKGSIFVDRSAEGVDAGFEALTTTADRSLFALSDPNGAQWAWGREATTNDLVMIRLADGVEQDIPFVARAASGNMEVIAQFTAKLTAEINVDSPTGETALFKTTTGDLTRWAFGHDATPQSGSDVGADYVVNRHDDAGTVIDTPFRITRSTGEAIFTESVYLNESGGTGFVDMIESSTPPVVPASDHGRLYMQDVSGNTHLFFKNTTGEDAATGIDLTAGAVTAGEANTLSSPTAASEDQDPTQGKTLVDLEMKRFRAASANITIVSGAGDTELVFDVPNIGLGDVVGPGSATDHALARFDSVTGKLLQNSVAILTDAGTLSGITNITGSLGNFVTGTAGSDGEGVQWDANGNVEGTGFPVGDVVSVSGTTVDDQMVIYDGTTGKSITKSAAFLTELGAMSGVTTFEADSGTFLAGSVILNSQISDNEIILNGAFANADEIIFQRSSANRWSLQRKASTDDLVLARYIGGTYQEDTLTVANATGSAIWAKGWAVLGSLTANGTATFGSYLDVDEIGAPGDPAADVGRLFMGDVAGDTHLFFGNTTDASPPIDLTLAGAGGGETNTLSTPTAGNESQDAVQGKTLADLEMKKFVAGTGITITSTDTDTSLTIASTVQAGGDVSGPGTSTDHAISRWDGTGGTDLLDSGVTISDTNVVAGVANITGTLVPGVLVTGIAGSDGHGAKWDINGDLVTTGAPPGDVLSSTGVSVDNRIAVYDGIGGKTIQQTGVTISDLNALSGVSNVTGTDTDFVTGTQGTDGNVAIWNADGDIVDGGVTPGNVTKVGTPVDNQVGVWTGDGTIEGSANLQFNGAGLGIGTAAAVNVPLDILAAATGSANIQLRNNADTFSWSHGVFSSGTYSIQDNSTGDWPINLGVGAVDNAFRIDSSGVIINDLATFSAGTVPTVHDLGTVTTGTTTIERDNSSMQRLVANGAFTLAAESEDSSIALLITNGASAGAITLTGVTDISGDTLDTTNTNRFMLYYNTINGAVHLHIEALQ